jgi:hypothetical protein
MESHAFELQLTHRDENQNLISHNLIVASDIIQLLSQFNMLIAMIQRQQNEKIIQELTLKDDDIPF